MYVCSYDLHYNVLWGRYASELKGLTKKLLFSILPRKKDFHAKLQVHFGFLLPCFITSSCIVMYVYTLHCSIIKCEMMMSVLQEIKGLTKELYIIILSRRKSSFHAKFQVHCSHGLPVLT